MAESEMVRVATLSEDERVAVNALSSQERKEVLVRAGQVKMRNANERLFQAFLERIQRGEVGIWVNDPDTGRPWRSNGKTMYYRSEQEPMEDIGRVPDSVGIHACRKSDGSLFFMDWSDIREEGEKWADLADLER